MKFDIYPPNFISDTGVVIVSGDGNGKKKAVFVDQVVRFGFVFSGGTQEYGLAGRINMW
jgi:hypothetical protein